MHVRFINNKYTNADGSMAEAKAIDGEESEEDGIQEGRQKVMAWISDDFSNTFKKWGNCFADDIKACSFDKTDS